jgi:hypothetical protein
MTEQEYLNMALSQMHSGQWFGWKKDFTGTERMSYENIIIHDNLITMPTKAEVEAKIQELKDAEVAREVKREEAKAKLLELGLTEEHLKALGI